jgi:cytoskeletal protein CcmA (bactofilin family)
MVSCPDEGTWNLYVDGELDREGLRGAETHLVRCQDCRARVVALRDEVALLSALLHEAPSALAPAPRLAPAAQAGWALGLPAALAATLLVLGVAGFLLESRLASGPNWLRPLGVQGATEMLFDLAFMLRDRAPGFVELALSLAAVASVAGLGSLVAGALLRRVAGGMAALLLLLGAAQGARALDLRIEEDERVVVAAGETVADTLVVTAEQVQVDGVVEGDLVVAADRLTLRGVVHGDLYLFVRELDLAGSVEGSLHGAVEQLHVTGSLAGGVLAATERFDLADSGQVGRDVRLFAEGASLEGSVGRDVHFAGDWLEVRGAVARDVEVLAGERASILGGARIGRNVTARLPEGDAVFVAEDAQVTGEVATTHHEHGRDGLRRYTHAGFYLFAVLHFAASFVFGLVLFLLLPSLFRERLEGSGDLFRSLGLGFLALVATPVAVLAVALTVVGLPIAVLGLVGYLTALYASDILVGFLVGRALLPPADDRVSSFSRSLLAGLAVVFVAQHLPFLGFAVIVVVVLLGLGLLVRASLRISRQRSPS